MKKLITKFNETGICEVDVNKVVKAWNNKFSISQYKEEYRLIKQYRGENCSKVTISTEQAQELIIKLELLPIQSSVFRNAKTYRTRSNIISEKIRIESIYQTKVEELKSLKNIIEEFENALKS